MKKLIAIAGLLLVLTWAIYLAIHALASPETRLRWMLEEIETSFNDYHASGIRAALAEDFEARPRGVDRRTVMLFLMQFFQKSREADGSPSFRVEIERDADDELVFELKLEEGSPPTARVSVTVEFLENRGSGESSPEWKGVSRARFTADCAEVDGDWKIRGATREVESGELPF